MTSFNGDTRTYNSLFQLTRITAGTSMDIEYNYTAGANNGRITSSLDHVTGENVTYTYDSLSRLTQAATADNLWGTNYTYDGWGNLLSKSVFKGTAPTYSTTIDPATNGGPGQEPAPGSWTYDVERRMLTANGSPGYKPYWSYDPNGKRIFQKYPNWQNPGTRTTCEVYFYAITGQKLATYGCHYNDDGNGDGSFSIGLNSRNEYFGGKPLKLNGVAVVTDRLGSVRWNGNGERFNYYPYGEERGNTANGREKFGTYFRDQYGLDYADQRYYDSTKGRFTTADPAGASAVYKTDAVSWNRFGYAGDDPVNYSDLGGLVQNCPPGTVPLGQPPNMYCQSTGGLGVPTTSDPRGPAPPVHTKEEYDDQHPKPDYCISPHGAYETTDVNFMTAHWGDAQRVSRATGLPVQFIIGWASLESYNTASDGLGEAASKNNNFFGLTYRGQQSQTVWKGSIECGLDSYDGIRGRGGHSCFAAADGFYVSAISALTSFDNKYLDPATHIPYSNPSLTQIGQAIADAGFNPNPAYGASISSRWNRLAKYMDCVR